MWQWTSFGFIHRRTTAPGSAAISTLFWLISCHKLILQSSGVMGDIMCYQCVWKSSGVLSNTERANEVCTPQHFNPDVVYKNKCPYGCSTTILYEYGLFATPLDSRESFEIHGSFFDVAGGGFYFILGDYPANKEEEVGNVVHEKDSMKNPEMPTTTARPGQQNETAKPPMTFFERGCPKGDAPRSKTGCEEKSYQKVYQEECFCTSDLCNGSPGKRWSIQPYLFWTLLLVTLSPMSI